MKIKWKDNLNLKNYKKPSMFLGVCTCDWKCCVEQGINKSYCWNSELYNLEITDIAPWDLFIEYISKKESEAIVIGGFEPFLQFDEVIELVKYFRENGCDDDFVIYTGYCENEITDKLLELKRYNNIIVKFGRFVINDKPRYDEILGLYLSSKNQYAKRIGG